MLQKATKDNVIKKQIPAWYKKLRSPWLSAFLMILPALMLYAVFYFFPLFRLLPESVFEDGKFTLLYFKRIFLEPFYFETLVRTIWICIVATLINLLLGYPVAYTLLIVKQKWANIILAMILISLWISILVRTYSWMVILQRTGIINQVLLKLGIIGESVQIMYTPTAVLIGMVHILLPYMIMPIYSVLRGIDPNLVPAASSLGASKTMAFIKITLPLSIPGIAAGVLLVFIQGLGFYVTPMLLGGPPTMMMSGLIDRQMFNFLNWSFGASLGVVLLFITIIFMLIFDRFFGIDSLQKRLI